MADLTDLGQALDSLAGVDAVVHFAAIPAPGLRPEGETFRIHTLSTYNAFHAAVTHRLRRRRHGDDPSERGPDVIAGDESGGQ